MIYKETICVNKILKCNLHDEIEDFLNDYDKICNIFANKIVKFDLYVIKYIKDYIHLANKIEICSLVDTDINYEIHSILEKINVPGIIITNNLSYPNNIGLFKLMFCKLEEQNIRKYMSIFNFEIDILYGSDIIENLHIVVYKNNTITIKNMPKLKIINTKMNPKYIYGDMIKKVNIVKQYK